MNNTLSIREAPLLTTGEPYQPTSLAKPDCGPKLEEEAQNRNTMSNVTSSYGRHAARQTTAAAVSSARAARGTRGERAGGLSSSTRHATTRASQALNRSTDAQPACTSGTEGSFSIDSERRREAFRRESERESVILTHPEFRSDSVGLSLIPRAITHKLSRFC